MEIEIIKANIEDKNGVLVLLDRFRTECYRIMSPGSDYVSDTAISKGGVVFGEVLGSDNALILIAKNAEGYVGVLTAYVIPQIRKGEKILEIEEFFVLPGYQGKGIAAKLMDSAISWAKEKGLACVRLETSLELKRAHSFYEKYGFKVNSKGYEYKF